GELSGLVKSRAGEVNLTDLQVQSWSFEVPDTKTGVMTVVKAFRHGKTELSPLLGNTELLDTLQEAYGFSLKEVPCYGFAPVAHEWLASCQDPVLIISPQAPNYYCLWGGVLDTYNASICVDPDESEDDWSADFYQFHKGMKDGGCLMQSATSSATIMAKKHINRWTITLTMPTLDNGNSVGKDYEAIFRFAYNGYCNLMKRYARQFDN
ncbi:MAG: hypothetical protein K2M76_03550, partial [Muribaculaceae bacterium]|nr:hypothetical protein [Muribaculaceae bacterium]